MNAVRLWNLEERTMASAILHITSLFSLTKNTSLVSSIPFRNRHNLRNRIPKPKVPSSSRNGNNNLPETECPVPFEQQPINEYQTLSTSFPFSWASADIVEYCSRLFVIGASFALFIGLPVAWFGAAGANSEPLKRSLCAVSSGIFVVTLAVLRMYLGWAYVGNRLLSATVEYEETGWYDGQRGVGEPQQRIGEWLARTLVRTLWSTAWHDETRRNVGDTLKCLSSSQRDSAKHQGDLGEDLDKNHIFSSRI